MNKLCFTGSENSSWVMVTATGLIHTEYYHTGIGWFILPPVGDKNSGGLDSWYMQDILPASQ
jgi:hypothetical protein